MSTSALHHLSARWQQLSARERALISLALACVCAALLWWVALAPALTVWRDSARQHERLDRQQDELLSLQAQARQLQSRPVLSRTESSQSLAQQTRSLLPGAQLSNLGDRSVLTLKGVSGTALAQWLTAIRQTAQATVVESQLQRSPTSTDSQALWDGQVVVQLPQRGAP
jgi:general secretion pathway protein M